MDHVAARGRKKALVVSASISAVLIGGLALVAVLSERQPRRPDAGTGAHAGGGRPVGPEAPRHGAAGAAEGRKGPGEGLGFVPGDVLGYRFSHRARFAFRAPALPADEDGPGDPGPAAMETRTSGAFLLRVYGRTGSGWMLGLELSEVVLERPPLADGKPAAVEGAAKDLAGEVLAAVGSSGEIEKAVLPPSMPGPARMLWGELLSRWQVVLADGPSGETWKVQEEDLTGRYIASYRRAGKGKIEKSKVEYTTIRSPEGGEMEARAEVTGKTEIVLDPRPLSIEGQEALRIESEGMPGAVDSEVQFSFRRCSQESDPRLAALFQAKRKALGRAGSMS